DSNRRSGFCRPVPYRLAMAPGDRAATSNCHARRRTGAECTTNAAGFILRESRRATARRNRSDLVTVNSTAARRFGLGMLGRPGAAHWRYSVSNLAFRFLLAFTVIVTALGAGGQAA